MSRWEPLAYPGWIESWWLDLAQEQLGEASPADCLERLAQDVQQLSDRFIGEEGSRSLASYGQRSDPTLAYGLFFFPQTFTRVQFPLWESIQRGWCPPLHRPLRVLDLGAGLGSASLGIVHLLKSHWPALSIEVHAVEQASLSLSHYDDLTTALGEYWPGCSWTMHCGDMRDIAACDAFAPEEGWDIVIASFSVNEAFEGAVSQDVLTWWDELLQRLAPGGLGLILEPASAVASTRLLALREAVVANDAFQLCGPCLHASLCPLADDAENHCHEVRSWWVPDSLEYMNRTMFRALHVLKFGYLALRRKDVGAAGDVMLPVHEGIALRLISPVLAKKGRFLATSCTEEGEKWPLEIQMRSLASVDKKRLRHAERGDLWSIRTDDVLSAHPNTGLVRLPKTCVFAPIEDGEVLVDEGES